MSMKTALRLACYIFAAMGYVAVLCWIISAWWFQHPLDILSTALAVLGVFLLILGLVEKIMAVVIE